DLGEVGHRLEPASGAGGIAFAQGHDSLPPHVSNRSILLPAERVTTARLVSDRLPNVGMRRLRLRLPLRLSVFTLVTRTAKISSTASRIWILVASERTTNVYTFLSSRA